MCIVVGIDGSKSALRAARWALDEAVGRDLPIRLVAAAETAEDRANASDAVHSAAAALQATGPSVALDVEVAVGEPAEVLLAASGSAAMLCIGGVGSTGNAVAASATCPVAVVRGGERPAAGSPGWVVVEVDETSDSAAVLQFGVQEARLRAAPLRVLGTWQPTDAGSRKRLDLRRETWQRQYPDLDVEPVAVPGSGLDWLSRHAAAIQLMVVGARNIVAVTDLLEPAGLAALPDTSIVIVDRQRLL